MIGTEELIKFIDEFATRNGAYPGKIVCGRRVFDKLRREATVDLHPRHLEPNYNDAPAAFMGIPVEVVEATVNANAEDMFNDDMVYILPEREYEPDYGLPPTNLKKYQDIRGNTWWTRAPRYEEYTPFQAVYAQRPLIRDEFVGIDFAKDRDLTAYYGNWKTEEEDLPDVSDEALAAVLNGGGFRVVA